VYLPDHPNTRSDLAFAAVASYSRAGRFDLAVEFGKRMLAEGDALTEYGRLELVRLVRQYSQVIAPVRPRSGSGRGATLRAQVREQWVLEKAA